MARWMWGFPSDWGSEFVLQLVHREEPLVYQHMRPEVMQLQDLILSPKSMSNHRLLTSCGGFGSFF